MTALNFRNAPCFYLEVGQSSLKALNADHGLELPLERLPTGRLTEACKEKVTLRLREFFTHTPWQPRPRAYCAIGARGVSLRTFSLPSATNENLHRHLLLQVESEFPVPPDDLAWGYSLLNGQNNQPNASGMKQQFLVAAVKKEAVEEYAEILSRCGVTPVFTLAALARSSLCPHPAGSYAVLDIGQHYSELLAFENGVPTVLRVLPWGGENLTRSLGETLGVTRDEAEKLKLTPETARPADSELAPKVRNVIETSLTSLVGALNSHRNTQRIYLTGKTARFKDMAAQLARLLGRGVECQSVEVAPGEGRSAAILGLRKNAETGRDAQPLVLQVKQSNGAASITRPAPWKWVALAGALALTLLVLPYAEALLLKAHLSKKLAAIKADRSRLGTIDSEYNFLQYLKQNQPPCLDTLYLLAKAAPQGTKLDSLSMNRRGDLSWRGTLHDSQQVADFRSKLIDSGLFASVSVDEQTPSPDRQKLTVRMSAQWKPAAARLALNLGPTAEEIAKAKTNPPTFGPPGAAGFPMGFPGMGGGPPPGMPMPPPGRAPRSVVMPGKPGAPSPSLPPDAMPTITIPPGNPPPNP
ncbi:MAG TPA: pilus assembly protein PilM [Candidatus Binatia bacterium]|jgi:type IV pilus assembly protein PilM|nr:pilus assembly protein PilM [Candidatus Binatia bacterium]